MSHKVRYYLVIFLIIILLIGNASAMDMPKTNSYTYSSATGSVEALYCPMPFLPEEIIFLTQNGANVQSASDMCFDSEKNLYVVDRVGNAIVKLDQNYHYVKTITSFQNNGVSDFFNAPQDMMITEDGSLYICDTDNNRIVVLDKNEMLVKIYTAPQSELLSKDFSFSPVKITVDVSGNMYMINQNDVNGILQLDANGDFVNYIGSNDVAFNAVEAFWKSIMTNEQVGKMAKSIPIQYTNLSMDSQAFIYAVSSSKSEAQPIRRLNLSGTDVLDRNGYVDVIGDIKIADTANTEDSKSSDLTSSFIDIVSRENGVYFALDATYCRIFAYNQDGYLLYAFGGSGDKAGLFRTPCAIEKNKDDLIVLDQANNTLTVLKVTEYASLIEQADACNRNGQYDTSYDLWSKVLQYNANYELAYAQIGNVYLEKGEYQTAMKYFQLGNYRGDGVSQFDGYNKAFVEYTKQFAKKNLGLIVCSLMVFVIGLLVFLQQYRRRKHRLINSTGKGETDA